MRRSQFMRGAVLAATVVLAGACGADPDTARAAAEPEIFSLHWPAEQLATDVRMCVIAATGETIALDPDPIVGLAHVDSAYLADPADDFVTVRWTPHGRATLAAATAQRIGERLAIVIEDEVVELPVINQSLDIEALPLMPMQSSAAAEALAARIRDAAAARRGG